MSRQDSVQMHFNIGLLSFHSEQYCNSCLSHKDSGEKMLEVFLSRMQQWDLAKPTSSITKHEHSTTIHRITWVSSSHDLGFFVSLQCKHCHLGTVQLRLIPVLNQMSSLNSVKLLLNYRSMRERTRCWNQMLHNLEDTLLKSITKVVLIILNSTLYFE